MNRANRKNLLILSFTLLVMMLGYAMAMPLMPFYIEKFGVGGSELGWLMSTYSLMQLICAPLWGALSDRVGRKPVLCAGVLGYAVALLLFGLSTQFWMLFAARSLSGVLSSATQPTAMAYVGDNAPEKERSKSMGQLGAVMGIGVILGPLIGGLLSQDFLALPFFVGSGLAFLALLLVIAFLPESKPAASPSEKPAQPAGEGLAGQPALDRSATQPPHPRPAALGILLGPAGVLLLLVFILSFGMTNVQGMIGLYVVDKFAFDTRQVGVLWMVMGGMLILVQGGLIGPLSKRFSEPALIRLGLLGGALGFLLIAAATGYLTLLLAMAGFMLALGIIGPTLNSYLIGFAGEQRGAVMGVNSAATSLGRVIGPLWAGYIYDINIEYPLFSGALVLALGWLVGLFVLRKPSSPSLPV
jgi:DHA1 family multidrug resistance protein-like MFS transporter